MCETRNSCAATVAELHKSMKVTRTLCCGKSNRLKKMKGPGGNKSLVTMQAGLKMGQEW